MDRVVFNQNTKTLQVSNASKTILWDDSNVKKWAHFVSRGYYDFSINPSEHHVTLANGQRVDWDNQHNTPNGENFFKDTRIPG